MQASPPETVKSIPQDKTVFVHESSSTSSSEEVSIENTLKLNVITKNPQLSQTKQRPLKAKVADLRPAVK